MPFRRIGNNRGLTILEVLIASAIFMVGFSLMVFLLNQLISGFSLKEYVAAYQLASNTMELTLASGEFVEEQTVETVTGNRFLVEQLVTQEGALSKVRINILRPQNKKLLVTLYAEKNIPPTE
ncbi:MAG: hypothetical protein HRF51_01580 [bacterium]|jgi:Tfp pilus assembly protein PilV